MKINVGIVEDLKDVAEVLCDSINDETDMVCNQVYNNAEEAMVFLPRNPVDVVIVDIGLPRASGLEVIKKVGAECPNTQFCMFTVYDDDEKIFKSIHAGAKGYILKGDDSKMIINSIRELYQGGSPMSHNIARRIINYFTTIQPPVQHKALPLTERESQLLELISKGLMYKEIGDKLGITIGTVKQHIHKIYEKLQVNNKIEAINKFNNQK